MMDINIPKVSVVIPTCNRKKYIIRAIDSVLEQTYKNIEIIVVDDCSNDDTSEIVLRYSSQDPRMKVVKNQTKLGFPKSLNRGVAMARGEYIARIDDDDFWSDNKKLEKQVNFLENNPAYVMVGGGAIRINEDGKEIFRYLLPEKDEDIRKRILSDNCFVHSTVVFRKKAWESAKGYNKDFGPDCDWGLWLELGKLGKFYNFPEYFAYYLKWSKNISNLNAKSNFRIRIQLCQRYGKDYSNYWKAFFLGLAYYLYSSSLRWRELHPIFLRIRELIFVPPPYRFKNYKNEKMHKKER